MRPNYRGHHSDGAGSCGRCGDRWPCEVARILREAVLSGREGGAAGTGEAKRRTKEHYQEMARRSAEVRRANKDKE